MAPEKPPSQQAPGKIGLYPTQYLGLSVSALSTPNSLSNYFAVDHLFFDLPLAARIKQPLEGAPSVDSDKQQGGGRSL